MGDRYSDTDLGVAVYGSRLHVKRAAWKLPCDSFLELMNIETLSKLERLERTPPVDPSFYFELLTLNQRGPGSLIVT